MRTGQIFLVIFTMRMQRGFQVVEAFPPVARDFSDAFQIIDFVFDYPLILIGAPVTIELL